MLALSLATLQPIAVLFSVSFTSVYCFAASDENERASRVPQHHGTLAPQRLLAAHHTTAQHWQALRSARYGAGVGRVRAHVRTFVVESFQYLSSALKADVQLSKLPLLSG